MAFSYRLIDVARDRTPGGCGAERTQKRSPSQHAKRASAAAVRAALAARNPLNLHHSELKPQPRGRGFFVADGQEEALGKNEYVAT